MLYCVGVALGLWYGCRRYGCRRGSWRCAGLHCARDCGNCGGVSEFLGRSREMQCNLLGLVFKLQPRCNACTMILDSL